MATEPETLIPLVAFSQVEKVSGDCVGGRGLLPGCRQHMGGRRRGGQRGLQSQVRLGCQAHACLFPQVVLLGDHKQLRPVVKNEQLQSLGLDRSLFERYHKEAYMLDTQYRMVSPAPPGPRRSVPGVWPRPRLPHPHCLLLGPRQAQVGALGPRVADR